MQPRSKFTHSTRAPRVLCDPMLKNDLFLLFSKLAEIKVKLRIGETNYRVFGSHFDAHRRGRCFVYSLNLFLRLETKISVIGNLIFQENFEKSYLNLRTGGIKYINTIYILCIVMYLCKCGLKHDVIIGKKFEA